MRRLAAISLAGGVVAFGQLGIASSASAADDSPADCPSYAVVASTNTTLSISPAKPAAGDDVTLTATVTSGGVPVPNGDVVFSFSSGQSGDTKDATVSGGTASATFTIPDSGGRFTVGAYYQGQCLGGSAAVGTSNDTQAIVAGVEATGGGSDNGGGNAGGNDSTASGALASTGLDGQTELFGALGVGLVAVGALTMVVHRRRVQA